MEARLVTTRTLERRLERTSLGRPNGRTDSAWWAHGTRPAGSLARPQPSSAAPPAAPALRALPEAPPPVVLPPVA
jgi:hypothetical protein